LNGELASATHAANAHISIGNPAISNSVEIARHHPNEKINKYSSLCAIFCVSFGKI